MAGLKTPVAIIDQPYKVGWLGNDLYLEVQTGEKSARLSYRGVIPESVANAEGVTIDWKAVERAVEEDSGVPQVVGHRSGSAQGNYLPMIF